MRANPPNGCEPETTPCSGGVTWTLAFCSVLRATTCLALVTIAPACCSSGGATGDFVDVTMGWDSVCGRSSAGTIACWGRNGFGQLGFEPRGRHVPKPEPRPRTVDRLRDVKQLAMSIANTCALLSDGTVSCWGSGVCSDDSTTCYTPTPVPGLNDAVQISLDGELWAVHRTGTVTCWKRWRDATAIPGLAGVVEVASGASHNCARLADGTVRCWGSNVYGALGEGTTDTGEGAAQPTTYRTEPGHVAGLSDVAQISAFSETTCAVTKQGQVACWGKNERGRLGNGEWGGEQSRPVVIDGITTAVEVDVGAHACARLRDGTMRCWGWNAWGMLGDGTDVDSATRPVVVRGLSGVKQIAVGSTSTCARTDRGTYCWGFNNYGQLGDGTTQDRPAPTLVRF